MLRRLKLEGMLASDDHRSYPQAENTEDPDFRIGERCYVLNSSCPEVPKSDFCPEGFLGVFDDVY